MKKFISSLVVIALLVTSLFILTGCNKSSGGDKATSKIYENAETATITDKWNGLEVKFAYPKDKGFEAEYSGDKSEYQGVILTSEDLNAEIQVDFDKVAADEVERVKADCAENTEDYAEFEEIEFAGYKGFAVNEIDWSGTEKTGLLMLAEVEEGNGSEEGWYALEFSITALSSSDEVEFDPTAYYKEEDFQNLLKSVQFSKIEQIKVDGVLGEDRSLIVKTLTPPNDEYEVSQFADTNGVMSAYRLKDGKYNDSGAYFRIYCMNNIDEEKFGELDKVLAYYESDTWNYTYTDSTLAGQKVKVEHNPKKSATSEKYSVWESGYFEKDGKVYNYLYYRYEDVPEEIGTQLITDVLSGISFYQGN